MTLKALFIVVHSMSSLLTELDLDLPCECILPSPPPDL